MKLLIFCLTIALTVLMYLFLRLLVKRLILVSQLKAAARRLQAELVPTKPFWFLGTRRGKSCDFYFVTAMRVYSVKLFNVKNRRCELHFIDDSYFIRELVPFSAGMMSHSPSDSQKFSLRSINYRADYRKEWNTRDFVPTLLIHPIGLDCCRHVDNAKIPLGAGDSIGSAVIYSAAQFISITK